MPLQFTWLDYWNYYEALEDKDLREHLEQEAIGQGWLYRQPVNGQVEVLSHAPKSFVSRISMELKPEAAIKLGFNPFLRR